MGENIWVTARHVIEHSTILDVGTTKMSVEDYSKTSTETGGVLAETGGVLLGEMFSMDGGYALIGQAMSRYGLKTKREAVDLALRRLVGAEPLTLEEALAMEGTGWDGDLDELRSGSEPPEL